MSMQKWFGYLLNWVDMVGWYGPVERKADYLPITTIQEQSIYEL